MSILSKTVTAAASLLCLILPAIGAEDQSALRSVVEAENNFARTSVERGIRESFLQNFADDAIIFAPDPKNGKKFYTAFKDKGRKLMWQPVFATIASSGDLGVTTGPWELQTSATDTTPLGFGDFLSIWKKQRDNSWKVIADVGVEHPQPSQPPGDIQLLSPSATPAKLDVDPGRRALEKAEQTLAGTLKEGAGSGILASASNDIRVLRDNSFPAVGKTAAKLMIGPDNGKMRREKMGEGMSAAADLAYRYGSYSSERGNVTEHGHFLTIWRAEGGQDWKILVDLQKKTPEPEKKP
jgi:ketosteroid isomerase-like protein